MPKDASKSAQLYRMVMQDHLCPYGLKSKDLLEREGYEVEDHHLTTREETDAFMEKHGVETTPQTWIGDKRIGGYDDLRVHFGNHDWYRICYIGRDRKRGWRLQELQEKRQTHAARVEQPQARRTRKKQWL